MFHLKIRLNETQKVTETGMLYWPSKPWQCIPAVPHINSKSHIAVQTNIYIASRQVATCYYSKTAKQALKILAKQKAIWTERVEIGIDGTEWLIINGYRPEKKKRKVTTFLEK